MVFVEFKCALENTGKRKIMILCHECISGHKTRQYSFCQKGRIKHLHFLEICNTIISRFR